jgi:hypothetical protein
MICPTCNAWTRTLETREKPGHTTYRRYECANGHTVKTMESVIVVPVSRADEVRRLVRQDYPNGLTVAHLALCLGMPAHAARNILTKMRDAYIKSWVNQNGKWVELWDIAEGIRDVPYHCPKPIIKPPKVKQ